jgi:type I restriction enzyme S subunit
VCHIAGRIGFRGYTKADLVKNDGAITLSPSNIIDGKTDYSRCTYISWEKYEESPEIMVECGDILLVKTGSSYGKAALVTPLPRPATINPQFVVIKHIRIDNRFLTFVLQSVYARKRYDAFVLGTAIPTFTQEALGNMLLPLPSIEEQQRIVNQIENYFQIISSIDSSLRNIEDAILMARTRILDLAIHGRLVPQDPTEEPAINLLRRINPAFQPSDNLHYEGVIPDGWQTCRLSDLFKVTMGQSPDGTSLNRSTGIEFHQGKICFTEKYLSESDIFTTSATKCAEPNSLLCCVRAPVGVFNITSRRICIGRGLCSLSPLDADVDIEYWFYALSSLTEYYESMATGSTFKAISGEIIRNTVIAVPPKMEQQRILKQITSLFSILKEASDTI